MNYKVSPEQIRSYRENGFIAIPDFLSTTELNQWRQATQEAVDQRLASKYGLNNQTEDRTDY